MQLKSLVSITIYIYQCQTENMNKSIFAVMLCCLFIGCNNHSTPSSATVDSTQNDIVDKGNADSSKSVINPLGDWEIGDSTFKRMLNEKCPFAVEEKCKLRAHRNVESALALIKNQYPATQWDYDSIPARFGICDVVRYKRNRKRKDPEYEKVRGRATLIFVVTPKDNKVNEVTHYFDICIICPPPNISICDMADPIVKW